jgi:diguanylate cyclase (GGDEF)-like protein
MAKQTPSDTSMLSDALARVTQELAQAQDELQQYHQRLTALHRLTDALASSPDEEEIIKVLTKGLAPLVDPVMVGVARSHRNHAWVWSDSQNREREAQVRRYLLRRLGQSPSHDAEANSFLRGGRSRHLRLVPPSASHASMQEQDSTLGQEVPLTLGSEESGLLLVQLQDPDHFTPREREVLETVGAALSLALRHAKIDQQARTNALHDPLTDLLNPQAFESALMRELSVGLRYGVSACLLLLDLDFFRIVNDRLGHTVGDQVLKMVADLMRETVRDSDIVGRYRGNTFAVVLPHTNRQQAHSLAERLRERVERYPFTIEAGQVRTTASIGLAAVQNNAVASIAEWMMVGDAALKDAKAQGRNRVVLHAPKPPGVACAMALSCAA